MVDSSEKGSMHKSKMQTESNAATSVAKMRVLTEFEVCELVEEAEEF